MGPERELSADCARCEGLCCVSLPFDRGPLFGFDKPADVPCRHLSPSGSCEVHGERRRLGLGGCVSYDCYGAGQRVTAELCAERAWREDPEHARRVFEIFRTLATAHELLSLLREAGRLELTPVELLERERLLGWLEPPDERAAEAWLTFDVWACRASVLAFLRGLRSTQGAPRRRLPLAG